MCKTCGSKGDNEQEKNYGDWKSAKIRFWKLHPNPSCAICGLTEWLGRKFPLMVDHIIPVAQGGKTTMSNLQPICANCHLIKSADEHPIWELD